MIQLLLSVVFVVSFGQSAFAQPKCRLDEASRAYAAGALDQATQTIAACLAGRPTEEERIQAIRASRQAGSGS